MINTLGGHNIEAVMISKSAWLEDLRSNERKHINYPNLKIQNPKSEILQNPKHFEHQYDATSRKFHTRKLCFTHKIINNIV
jgi:hypothetical protein